MRATKLTLRRPIIADKAYIKLKYSVGGELNIGANAQVPTLWNFRGNSCYDCDKTNTGHQPAGWDQWKQFYSHYRVTGCKITARFIANGNPPANCIIIASDAADGADLPNTWSIITPGLIRELNYTRIKMIGGSTTPLGAVTVKHYMTTSRIFGKALNTMDDLIAPVTGNAPHTWFFQVGIQRVLEGGQFLSQSIFVTVVVTLKYYVEFSGRKNYYPDNLGQDGFPDPDVEVGDPGVVE